MKKRVIPIVILAAAAVCGIYWLQTSKTPGTAEAVYSGYGEGELVYLSAPLGGELQELAVKRGDQASKGAVMFSLERDEEKAARAQAEETLGESKSQLAKAQLDFNRAKSLRDKRVNTPEEFDTAQQTLFAAQHNAAARQGALDQADWRFRQKQQTAPVSGLVYDTYFRPGEWVAAGSPVLSLLPPEYMKVRFFVPETDLGKFLPGTAVTVKLDGAARDLPARVSFVSPQAEYTLPIIYSRENRAKLVFLVEASLAPDDARQLLPGAPVEVRLPPATPQP